MNMKNAICRDALVLCLLPGTLLVGGCGKEPTKAVAGATLPTVQVRVQTVELKPQQSAEEVVGTVRAKLRATLEAKISGRIDQMPVGLGQSVKAGELIAHLDAPEIRARVEQAKADSEQAEREWKRISGLFGQQAVTRSEYDAAEAKRQVALARVAEAQAMQNYVQVMAPFGGRIARKLADVGDLAMPGKPLVELEDPSVLQMDADVPEGLASHIGRESRLIVRHGPSNEVAGVISEVAPSADPNSRTVRVKLDLPSGPDLIPGRFARLEVPLGEGKSLQVPASAIVQRGQLELAFVITDQRARLHLVKSGKRVGEGIEILSGLDPGDEVVVEGAAQLVDGQPVEVK